MVIQVYNLHNFDDCRIYKNAYDVVDSSDGESFTVATTNLNGYRFNYKDFYWQELTPDEAMIHGSYTKENENLKYKLSVDDSGYGMNCTECERIIFIKPNTGDSVELDSKKLSELDWININGIKFRREK